MARSRNIKPGFFKNEDLAECSVWARLLFPGLWMLADREGRIEDRPKRIKGEIFPFDAIEVEPLLCELVQWGFVHRYVIDNKKCIQVRNFSVHQSPHGTEKDSDLPDESGYYTVNERAKNGCFTGKTSQNKGYDKPITVRPSLDNGAITVRPPLDNGAITVRPPLDNALIPDSLIPEKHVAVAPCDSCDKPEKQKTEKPMTETDMLKNAGIDGQLAKDFLKVRRAKKAPLTQTALDGIAEEAAIAGITTAEAVLICTKKNWQGFNAGWDWKQKSPNPATNRTSGYAKQPQQRPEYVLSGNRDVIDSTAEILHANTRFQ